MSKVIVENLGYGSHTFHLGKYVKNNLGKDVFEGRKIVISHGENAIDEDDHVYLLKAKDGRGNVKYPRYSEMFDIVGKNIGMRQRGFKTKVRAEDYADKSCSKKGKKSVSIDLSQVDV